LSVAEAAGHQQYVARAFFREIDGIVQPGPVPAFSLTVPATPSPHQTDPYTDAAAALADWLPKDQVRQFCCSA
jgi:alpha-methylacyl-CoA racemase